MTLEYEISDLTREHIARTKAYDATRRAELSARHIAALARDPEETNIWATASGGSTLAAWHAAVLTFAANDWEEADIPDIAPFLAEMGYKVTYARSPLSGASPHAWTVPVNSWDELDAVLTDVRLRMEPDLYDDVDLRSPFEPGFNDGAGIECLIVVYDAARLLPEF